MQLTPKLLLVSKVPWQGSRALQRTCLQLTRVLQFQAAVLPFSAVWSQSPACDDQGIYTLVTPSLRATPLLSFRHGQRAYWTSRAVFCSMAKAACSSPLRRPHSTTGHAGHQRGLGVAGQDALLPHRQVALAPGRGHGLRGRRQGDGGSRLRRECH